MNCQRKVWSSKCRYTNRIFLWQGIQDNYRVFLREYHCCSGRWDAPRGHISGWRHISFSWNLP